MYQFPHKNILDTDQFSKEDLDFIIQKTNVMKELLHSGKSFGMLHGKLLASLFFEASTRTRLSFESAMERLGGRVISTVGFQFSSISKGETLYDTMKMIEAYADIAVIRHPVEGSSRIAAGAVKSTPNAGTSRYVYHQIREGQTRRNYSWIYRRLEVWTNHSFSDKIT